MKEEFKGYEDIEQIFSEIQKLKWYEKIYYRATSGVRSSLDKLKMASQRVKNGHDDTAWWSMDTYLSSTISKLAKELRTKGNGVPVSMYEGLPTNSEGDYDDSEQAIAKKRWDNILLDIEEGFTEYVNIQNCVLSSSDYKLEKFDKAFDLLRENFSNLWD